MQKQLGMALLLALPCTASAITRTDVLVCEAADGHQFILRSQYNWSALPLPAIHSSRETERHNWKVMYRYQGKTTQLFASVEFVSRLPQELVRACAHFGVKQSVPLAPWTSRQSDGNWSRPQDLPLQRLDADTDELADPAARKQLQAAGIQVAAFNFGWIYRLGERMVFEKPPYRSARDGVFESPVDAVYQAWSDDGGKTWNDARVSTDARIFELGRSWGAQSAAAHPALLNGEPVHQKANRGNAE